MYSALKYFFILYWIMMNIGIRADDFDYHYFVYKSVPRVTIFSCEQTEKDFRYVRKMSSLGISVSVGHPRSKSYNITDHVSRKDNWILGLLLDTRCQTRGTNEKIIAQATKYRLYEGIHVWLVLATNFDEITQLFNDSSYSSLTDLVLAIKIDDGYVLYDVYNPNKVGGGILNITKMGYWNAESGLNVTLKQDKFSRRSNLHGIKIKVGTVTKYRPPGMAIEDHLQDYTRRWEDPVSKYGYTIIRQVADLFNFTMDIWESNEWAAMVNGTEIGMMVQLSKSQIDVGGSPCSANSRYSAYGRASMPGYPYRTFFLLRSNFERFKWTELLTPFTVDSWYAILFTSFLAVVIITAIQMTEYGEGWFAESGHAIFVITGVICQQGLTSVPNKLAGRIALLFLLFFGVLLFNYYGASVVSARLSEPPDKMNDSLYSLAKSHVKVAAEPFFVVDDNLNSRSLVEWEVRYFNERVWKKLSLSRYAEVADGLSKVAKGGYAYHTSAEVAYPYVGTHWDDNAICEMTEVHVITPRVLHFYERADNPFTEIIKIGLIKTANMGLQKRTVKHWKPKTPYCSPVARSLQSISFFDIAPAIMMMIIGVIVALLIHQIEKIMYKMNPTTSASLGAPKMERIGGKKTILRS